MIFIYILQKPFHNRLEFIGVCDTWNDGENGQFFEFFDRLLESCEVVGTPGSGFGKYGEGYFRLTAFGDPEQTEIALKRIQNNLKKLRF